MEVQPFKASEYSAALGVQLLGIFLIGSAFYMRSLPFATTPMIFLVLATGLVIAFLTRRVLRSQSEIGRLYLAKRRPRDWLGYGAVTAGVLLMAVPLVVPFIPGIDLETVRRLFFISWPAFAISLYFAGLTNIRRARIAFSSHPE